MSPFFTFRRSPSSTRPSAGGVHVFIRHTAEMHADIRDALLRLSEQTGADQLGARSYLRCRTTHQRPVVILPIMHGAAVCGSALAVGHVLPTLGVNVIFFFFSLPALHVVTVPHCTRRTSSITGTRPRFQSLLGLFNSLWMTL